MSLWGVPGDGDIVWLIIEVNLNCNISVCWGCWGPSSPFQTPMHPLSLSPNYSPLTLQNLWISSIPFFFLTPQRTQAVILQWSLASSPMSCLPTRICNSWQSVIHLSYMYWTPVRHWGCSCTFARYAPHPQRVYGIMGEKHVLVDH